MDILNLKTLVRSLPREERKIFRRIFRVEEAIGSLKIPAELRRRLDKPILFERQKIVKVTNRVTFEGTYFNMLRALRPIEAKVGNVKNRILRVEGCPFCSPLKETAEDIFGRISGKHGVTASNLAKYDGWHGLIIFKRHNPLEWTREEVLDNFRLALKWFSEAHKHDREAIYPFLVWNCLWRAGASIIHGHFQLTLSRTPHPKIENLHRQARKYQAKYGSNYFEDLYKVHKSLGLAAKLREVYILAYLTPIKEGEILVFSWRLNLNFFKTLIGCLETYRKLRVETFNLALTMPPMVEVEGWKDFPIIARLVDRGKLIEQTSDLGGMELYAASIVSSDPFKLAEELRKNVSSLKIS